MRDYLHGGDGAARGSRPEGRAELRGDGRRPPRDGARGRSDGHGAQRGVSNDESEHALAVLAGLSTDELLDVRRMPVVLGLGAAQSDPDAPLEARGYRLLHRLPRFPEPLVDRIVEHFAGLQGIMRTSVVDLEEVEGVGEARARSVKEGLARLAEASILDRYE
jgi:hypothetical protein